MQNTYLKKLQEREDAHLLRELTLPVGADFCSNDYLSFSTDVLLQKKILNNLNNVNSGSGGSRLLRGHNEEAVELERALAQWSGRDEAIFFPSGYQANLAVLSTVLTKQSIVFSDRLNHASIIDGIKLSGAAVQIFDHNSVEHLNELITQADPVAEKFVVVESLYSMRGDFAPLKEISDLCLKHQVQLIVDEMHATGLYGAGLAQRQDLHTKCLVTVHGAGKSLGVSGAWVACDLAMKDYFINFSRPFIYSTAPSPLLMSAVKTAVEHWSDVGEDRAGLCLDKAREFVRLLKVFLRDEMISGDGPIIYLQLKDSQVALAWSSSLQMSGFDVRAIRYPTVPENEAGLRISIHAGHGTADIKALVSAIRQMVIEC